MRVLMLHNRYLLPGGEDGVFQIERALLEKNGWGVSTYEENNTRISKIGVVRSAGRAIWSLESYRRVRRAIRRDNCDIVHIHNFFPLISPSAYYAARSAGVPVVQTLHNYRLLCPVGTFLRDGRICEDCRTRSVAWPGIRHACYRDSHMATGVVAAMISVHRAMGTWRHLVDTYIAPTRFVRDKFIQSGFDPERIAVKPNFVHPVPPPGPGGGGYALFVGRLSREKGIKTLLEAWRQMGGTPPLKIVGDGPLASTVAEAANQVEGVEWFGWQPQEAVYELMGKADALIMPSEWYEGHPRVTVEALAMGTPLIASNLGAMSEVVIDGETGFLFQPGNVQDLVSKVRAAYADRAALAAIRPKVRADFEAKYAPDVNYRLIEEIYMAAISRAKQRSAA